MGLTYKCKQREDRESGEVVETQLPCDHCDSSDAVVIYDRGDTFDSYCWSCDHVDYDPYKGGGVKKAKAKKVSKSKLTVEDINSRYRVHAIEDRGITKETCEHFGVRVAVKSNNPTVPTHHYYPLTKNGDVIGYKVRVVEGKKFHAVGKTKSADLFGYDKAAASGGKVLYITEGECDAMALYQVLKSHLPAKWSHIIPAVVSLKDGASSAVKSIGQVNDLIATFKTIVLVLDQDDAGQKAAKRLSKVISMPVKVAKLTRKDANEMLMAGLEKQLNKAVVFDAKPIRPDGIKTVSDLYGAALKPVKFGVDWPWPSLTAATYGRRNGELIVIGGGSGCGKTELLKECIQQDTEQGRPIGVMFLEEPGSRTIKVLAGKRVNRRFHIPNAPSTPDSNWTQTELVEALDEMQEEDLINIYDSSGVKDWEEIRNKIRWWVVGCGIKTVYLDHLTALTASEHDERKALDIMLAEMSSICEELDFTLVIVSHLTRPDKSRKAHEEGGQVRMADFRGSGAIGFWAHYMIGLERNTQSEDVDEKNTVTLRIIKDRYTGNATGMVIRLFFDPRTGRLLEPVQHDDTTNNDDGDY